MRAFTAVALLAGLAAAWEDSTTYTTLYSTITECPSSVTNCPARTTSQVLPLTTKTVYTTRESTIYACPSTVENCPYESATTTTVVEAAYTTVCPVEMEEPTTTAAPYYYPNSTVTYINQPTTECTESTESLIYTVAPACPTYSVVTISTSYTTVIPTVIYSTVEIPCPTATLSNYTTAPISTYTAGAAVFKGPVALAAAAGLAVLAFA